MSRDVFRRSHGRRGSISTVSKFGRHRRHRLISRITGRMIGCISMIVGRIGGSLVLPRRTLRRSARRLNYAPWMKGGGNFTVEIRSMLQKRLPATLSPIDDEQYRTAFHESGHVVLAKLFDVRCGRVRLVGEGRGQARIFSRDYNENIARWVAYGQHRTRCEAASIAVMISMAGSCAEQLFCDSDGGSDKDKRRVTTLADQWAFSQDELEALWRRTRRLLRDNAGAVRKLGGSLV